MRTIFAFILLIGVALCVPNPIPENQKGAGFALSRFVGDTLGEVGDTVGGALTGVTGLLGGLLKGLGGVLSGPQVEKIKEAVKKTTPTKSS